MELGTYKFYIDQQLPNYEARAMGLKTQFPNLRVGIGPAILNERYLGADKQQIEAFLAGFEAPLRDNPLPPAQKTLRNVQKPVALQTARLAAGDKIEVLLAGIGLVEVRFIQTQPNGWVLVDLDGMEEAFDPELIYVGGQPLATPKTPETRVEAELPPAASKAPETRVEAESPPAASKAPETRVETESPPTASKAPETRVEAEPPPAASKAPETRVEAEPPPTASKAPVVDV